MTIASARTFLRRLVTVAGAHTYAQAELGALFRARVEGLPDAQAVASTIGFVFEHSAIRRRHLELPVGDVEGRRDWYRLVNQATRALARRVLERLFSAGGTAPGDCDGLVVVSSTWAGFPGLGRILQQSLGFPLEAMVLDVAALGCAGPTHGLCLAQMLIDQGACHNVCLVCADAMGTHGQSRRHQIAPAMAEVVAHCLASDGAAALILSDGPGLAPVLSWRRCRLTSRLWPDSLDLNDLTADADNEPFISVGKDIRARLAAELGRLVDGDVLAAPVLLHPGGAALMRQIGERWPPLRESAALSMGVLEENGNVGSASVLFVLERALEARFSLEPRFRMVALGPGIVSTMLLADGVEAAS